MPAPVAVELLEVEEAVAVPAPPALLIGAQPSASVDGGWLRMASHAQGGSVHPELRDLEVEMVRLQSQEIAQMARWDQQWFGTANR